MIYDGIIELLQKSGGISVYFNEIISRYQRTNNRMIFLRYSKNNSISIKKENIQQQKIRILERYRDLILSKNESSLFHSTYYRLPKNKVPVITTVHDFTYEKYINGLPKYVHCWQKYRAIKNSDKIICISKNTADDLLKYCPIDENKIEIIYNGVSDDYKVISPLNSYNNEVLFIGSRAKYKNFSLAVNVISKMPDLHLTIIGGGELTTLEKSNLDSKIKGRYKWLGYVSNTELNEIYNVSYCLLYPSSYEGFGIPVIEAMRAGCPVIALNASSIPEIAGNAAILINTLNENNFIEALNTIDFVTERKKYIDAGLINSKRFSWNQCFDETNKVYSTLI